MNDLSPAAREMVESHRRGRMLSQAGRSRIKQKLMLRVATLGATTAAAGAAMGMSLASKIVLVAIGVSAIVGGGAVSFWALRGQVPSGVMSAGQPPVPSRTKAPQAVDPVPAAGAAASGDTVSADNGRIEYAKKIRRPVATAPTSESQTPTATAPSDPESELRVLREAREELRAGRAEIAYRRLDEYGRQHGAGMLAQERKALLAIALCQWQPGQEAKARAAEFLRDSPESPLVNRVRLACEKPKSAR